jgi:polyferredoxin
LWILIIAGITYSLAGFARELVCNLMCPWLRLQGAVRDPEALTVNCRDYRSEPRGSVKKAAELRAACKPSDDCVDCLQCMVVCPNGSDIRPGPSFACINCGLSVDACTIVMMKLGREKGRIDYESWRNIERGRAGLTHRRFRLFRPGTINVALGIVTLLAVIAGLVSRRNMGELFSDHE